MKYTIAACIIVCAFALGRFSVSVPEASPEPTSSASSTQMEHAMHSMMAELDGLSGDAFDRAFVKGMIVHHQGAVEMAEAALQFAQREEIKDLSRAIIQAQTEEIALMQAWEQQWW